MASAIKKSKIKISKNPKKSKIRKTRKSRHRKIEIGKCQIWEPRKNLPQICRLRSYRLESDEAPSKHAGVAITLRSPAQCLCSLYISSPFAVLLNEEIDLDTNERTLVRKSNQSRTQEEQ
jgi:hypothetical protein